MGKHKEEVEEETVQHQNENIGSSGKGSKFKELIELEFDVQQDIHDLSNLKDFSGSALKIIEEHNAEIKDKINKIHKMVKVILCCFLVTPFKANEIGSYGIRQ